MLAAPDREVVDAEHADLTRCGVLRGHDQPQQDLPGDGDAQPGGQP